jgi:hypothetical protein
MEAGGGKKANQGAYDDLSANGVGVKWAGQHAVSEEHRGRWQSAAVMCAICTLRSIRS